MATGLPPDGKLKKGLFRPPIAPHDQGHVQVGLRPRSSLGGAADIVDAPWLLVIKLQVACSVLGLEN